MRGHLVCNAEESGFYFEDHKWPLKMEKWKQQRTISVFKNQPE
jgi:hypothetical protein